MSIAKNDVLFLGMNRYASREAKALRENGVDVHLISDTKVNDQVVTGRGKNRKTYDLTDPAQVDKFVDTLGLKDAAQKKKVSDIIKNGQPDTRDELAQLAKAWAKGENGGKVPGRVVLSGHSNGGEMWGREYNRKNESVFENGYFQRADFVALAKAMPKAAAQVQDLAVSACFCGGEADITAWKEGFPNAKTVLAYDGKSPSGASAKGAQAHLKRWERFTRGDKETLAPERFGDLYKGKNVATWSVKNGYLRPGQETPAVVQKRIDAFKPSRADFLSGKTVDAAKLNAYYADLQNLRGRSSTPDALKAELAKEIDVMLRLRHHEVINGTFQKTHGPALSAGYSALGLTAPDLTQLTRKQTVDAAAALEAAVAKASPAPAAAQEALRLMRGLRDYDPSLIPTNWVG